MTRIRKSYAGAMPILVPGERSSRREAWRHAPRRRSGTVVWVAIALGAAGLLAWRLFMLMQP